MASAKLEIEVIDNGGSAVGQPAPSRSAVGAGPPSASSAAAAAGSAKGVPDKPVDESATGAIREGIKKFATALGYGGLIGTMEKLTQSIRDMAQVSRSATPANESPRAPSVAPQQPSPQPSNVRTPPTSPGERAGREGKRKAPNWKQAVKDAKQKYPPAPQRSPFDNGNVIDVKPTGAGAAPPRQLRLPPPPGAGSMQNLPVPRRDTLPIPRPATLPVPVTAGAGAGVTEAATGAALSLSRVAAFAGPVAAAGAAVVGLSIAAKSVTDHLTEQARALAKYSEVLSAAEARAGIRQQMSEMQRAEQLGPLLAKFENDSSKASAALYGLGTQALKAILELYALASPFVQLATIELKLFSAELAIVADTNKIIADVLTAGLAGNPADDVKTLLKDILKLGDLFKGGDDDWQTDPITQAFINQFSHPINPDEPEGRRVPNMFRPMPGPVGVR